MPRTCSKCLVTVAILITICAIRPSWAFRAQIPKVAHALVSMYLFKHAPGASRHCTDCNGSLAAICMHGTTSTQVCFKIENYSTIQGPHIIFAGSYALVNSHEIAIMSGIRAAQLACDTDAFPDSIWGPLNKEYKTFKVL